MAAVERHRFPSTQWSVVLAAASHGESTEVAREAFAILCETYWYPLYAYARRRGHDTENARDLTQGFFTKLLAQPGSLRPNRERGRFRSYLLGALKHYLANEWDRERARKRGGGQPLLRLDFEEGENRYRLEPSDTRTPEAIYEHRWALTVLKAVLRRLEEEYKREGRGDFFHRLKPLLTGEGERGAYGKIARELLMTEGALKVAVHRLRRRYREALRTVIAQTVETSSQIDDELRHLLAVVST